MIVMLIICGSVLVWAILTGIRIEIVHKHLNRRIDEVYASKNWYDYHPIDITGTYNLALWDYRKWDYEDFFPEAVK